MTPSFLPGVGPRPQYVEGFVERCLERIKNNPEDEGERETELEILQVSYLW
jgi:hypothetical protein